MSGRVGLVQKDDFAINATTVPNYYNGRPNQREPEGRGAAFHRGGSSIGPLFVAMLMLVGLGIGAVYLYRNDVRSVFSLAEL